MLLDMRHIEVHVVYTEEDAATISHAGLIDLTDDETCEHCGDVVAFDKYGDFVECAIVLDDESDWVLCTECVLPLLDPGDADYTEN
jgi:hypothetical protein